MDKYILYETCSLNSLLLTVNNSYKLQIWKPEDNSLLNEFQLPAHLSSNITAVKWARPIKRTVRSKKRHQLNEENNQFALGLKNGAMYVYLLHQGEMKPLLSEHSDAINALVWDFNNANLYACSNDKYISILNIGESTIKKWEADNNAIYAIQVCDSNYLLTASRNVKLWDINIQQVLKTFMGHIESINSIIVTQYYHESNNGPKKVTPLKKKLRSNKGKEIESDTIDSSSQHEDLQFLTSSFNERDIKLWSIKEMDDNVITPYAIYNLENNVHNVDTIHSLDSLDITYTSVVTKVGKLYLIATDTSVAHAKPIHPIINVCFKVKKMNEQDSLILPIICTKFLSCDASKLQLEEGSVKTLQHHLTLHVWYLKPGTNLPQFYSLNCDELNAGDNIIYRDYDNLKDTKDGGHTSKMELPDSQIKTVVDPKASMTLDSRIREILSSRPSIKRRADFKNVPESSVKASNNAPNYIPKADTLVALITQCLQAGDRMKLWDVLQSNNENVIKETVKRLPLKWICPFITELGHRMTFAKINELKPTLTWFDSILLQHASFLISTPEIYQDLSNVKELLTDRTSVFPKLMQLKGKLGHLIHQTQLLKENEGMEKNAIVEDTNDPALIYYEESDTEPDEGFGADMMF